jgi:hypothetical protein
MVTSSIPPLEDHPTPEVAAAHYRERAKMWRDSAAALPPGAPQQAVYLEIAEGYEKLAAVYEKRGRLATA